MPVRLNLGKNVSRVRVIAADGVEQVGSGRRSGVLEASTNAESVSGSFVRPSVALPPRCGCWREDRWVRCAALDWYCNNVTSRRPATIRGSARLQTKLLRPRCSTHSVPIRTSVRRLAWVHASCERLGGEERPGEYSNWRCLSPRVTGGQLDLL